MNLEDELAALGRELSAHAPAPTVDAFLDLVHAGEYGVALENLCDQLDDAQEPLTRAEVTEIRRLASSMHLDRESINLIGELEAPRH